MRRIRSWMFVPGNNPRYLDKASSVAADAVLLDLEDGVPVADKAEARPMVAEILHREPFGPLRYVRVNDASSPWFDDDLDAVVTGVISGICLPKVETVDAVVALSARLDSLERARGLSPGSTRIVAAIESALSLLNAAAIARADERISGLIFGAEDFALDLGLGTVREQESAELLYARSAVVVAAASAKILSIDGVYPDLQKHDEMLKDIWQARRLGFCAKSTFNPRQLASINEIFKPQPSEVEYARRVVEAFREAESRGLGSVAVGGQLIDLPIVHRAQALLGMVDNSIWSA